MIEGVEYKKHLSKGMQANKFKVIESCVSSLQVGETVYQVRQRADALLIGHTFHKSLWFDRETLECYSREGCKLLAKVERLK
jgi:hypothetical protein|nr:MAG TPA: hypothetical protein [Caudoviricetes sp.]